MANPTGFSPTRTHRPTAPRFAGSPANGAAGAAKPATPAKPPVKPPVSKELPKLSLFGTFKELFKELKNNQDTRNVVKGFTLKYLPDAAMTGLCAIPGIGWLANIIAIPFNMMLTNKGEKVLVETKKKLDRKNNKTHAGLHHGLAIDVAWNSPKVEQYYGRVKKRPLAEYVAHKYNRLIEGVFHRSEALQNRLKINWQGNSTVFKLFRRWTEARQSVQQSRLFGKMFNWMSGVSKSQANKALPKPLRLLFMVPRLGLHFIYFALGRAPKFIK